MQARFLAAAALAIVNLATLPAFAAGPDFNYLQNELDGRGRCLGAGGGQVAMQACSKSPDQQWVLGKGSVPSYATLHTMGGGAGACLAVHPNERRNVLSMEGCNGADNQQWYVERLRDVPRLTRLTNRETGATRCLEAIQTGIKMTPCSRRQAGHRWHSNYSPTM